MSSAPDTPVPFSLDPGPGLREMQDWVHGFAANVIRPAAAEWDEREETPWPILEEAAKIGLYSLEFFGEQWLGPTGLGIPIAFEELFWGDAGIALAIVGSSLAAVALSANGTNEQIGEWLPQMFGAPGHEARSVLSASSPRGRRCRRHPHRGGVPEASDEWVLDGTKTWATNGGIADVRGGGVHGPAPSQAGELHHPAGRRACRRGKFRKYGIPASHRRGRARRGARPGPLPDRQQGPAG